MPIWYALVIYKDVIFLYILFYSNFVWDFS